MDPKIESQLAESLEELESKIEPLREIQSLKSSMEKANEGLEEAASRLAEAGKPFPEALAEVRRASGLLSDAGELLKQADPSKVAEQVELVNNTVSELRDSLKETVTEEGDRQQEAVKALSEDIAKFREVVEGLHAERSAEVNEAIRHEKMAKSIAVGFGVVSLVLGGAIIFLLVAG